MWVLLPSGAAGGSTAAGGWQPTDADIADANSALSQVSDLTAENWKNSRIRIDHPETYFRQYVPMLRDGKNFLWLNAFCDKGSLVHWRTEVVSVDDGGTCFWQARFDPATKTYSHLRINGRG
jgi:hypothetical protein